MAKKKNSMTKKEKGMWPAMRNKQAKQQIIEGRRASGKRTRKRPGV